MPTQHGPFERHTKRGYSRSSIIATTLVSAIAICLVLLARYRYSGNDGSILDDATSNSKATPDHQGGQWRLHPLDHALRETTTIKQQWNVTVGERRPDGVLKPVYLVNDAFPGPTLETRSGDRLIIEVRNSLPNDEGLSIHWHGLSMRNFNKMDGAVGITENPIKPGEVFTYDFIIDESQHGTFWYHAHSAVQRADGLFGGLIVHRPVRNAKSLRKRDEYLLMVQDWYHRSSEQALDFYMHLGSFGNEPVPDSILLNGAGAFNCSDAVPARPLDCKMRAFEQVEGLKLDSSKDNLLRIINVGAYAGVGLSAGEAYFTTVAVDGGNEIEPLSARTVTYIHPGERLDVLVESEPGTSDASGLLSITLDTTSFKYPNPALTPKHSFPLQFSGSPRKRTAKSRPVLDTLDLSTVKARMGSEEAFPEEADEVVVLYTITQKLARLSNVPHGFINNTYWQPQAEPALPLLDLRREQWDEHQLVPHIAYSPDQPVWVDIVLNNLDEEAHPFHLHGYDFWVLSTYSSRFNWGSYNPWANAEPPGGAYNLVNPVKKDTVVVPRRGYAVLRLRADNPGLWMFHCHVLWHLASGMAMAFEIS